METKKRMVFFSHTNTNYKDGNISLEVDYQFKYLGVYLYLRMGITLQIGFRNTYDCGIVCHYPIYEDRTRTMIVSNKM